MFVEGRSLALRGFFYQDGVLQIKDRTSVYRSAPVAVSDGMVQEALTGLSKPIFAYEEIVNVLKNAERRKVSIKGIVITNHKEQVIKTKVGEDVRKKEIKIQDKTGSIMATLWREACSIELQAGDQLLLKDVVATYSNYNKAVTVSVNFSHNIEVKSNDELQDMALVAISNSEIEETLNVLVEINELERDLSVNWLTLSEFLKVDQSTPIEDFLQLLPVNMRGRIKQGEIVDLC